MNDLIAWLQKESGGVYTYRGFHERCMKLAANNPEHAAIYSILGTVATRFADEYDERPLPIEIADSAIEELRNVLKAASEASRGSPAVQLHFLNHLASIRLGAGMGVS